VSTKNITYKELRKMLDDPYFVQWVTEWDDNNYITRVAGFCVRRYKTGETVFTHESETVCRKVCDMLNENEEGANKC
jgi:hypothetical protein